MTELQQRVEGVAGRVRAMRRCCPDGPLWDALAALQLEVAELRTVVVDAGGGVDSVQSARLEGTGVGPWRRLWTGRFPTESP
jgi:hypothetical protein